MAPHGLTLDIVRCSIAFNDPYAMAVMLAFLLREFDVVRVKNRFEDDVVEEVSAERLQAEFYAAETLDDSEKEEKKSKSSESKVSESSERKSENFYRDVQLNLRPKGSDFICEVQLTLTGISILKKSEQYIYTLARMTSPEELRDTFVFSEQSSRGPARSSKEFGLITGNPQSPKSVMSAVPLPGDAWMEKESAGSSPGSLQKVLRKSATLDARRSLVESPRRAADLPPSPRSPSSPEHWVAVLPGAAEWSN